MRRPQTKQPYSFHHHGTRNKGYPVRRLYRPTPRKPFPGRFGYNDGTVGPQFIAYENLAGHTWIRNINVFISSGADAWALMISSGTPGVIFNTWSGPTVFGVIEKLWFFNLPHDSTGNWSDVFHFQNGMQGTFDWTAPNGPTVIIPA